MIDPRKTYVNPVIKVMNSYDYCHFEVTLGLDGKCNMIQIDEARKDAQRLVDKAIEQYKTAKSEANKRIGMLMDAAPLRREVMIIRENYPQSEWTPEQKAKVKALEDHEFKMSHRYNYEDEYGF